MPIIATATSDRAFEPAPTGVHRAVCVDVVDKGMLDVTWQGKTKQQHKIDIAWQIDEDREDGKPFLVFKRYTLSLSEKANLRKDLESWLGRKMTRDDEMGFDVEDMLATSCLLSVQQNTRGDKTYANVVSIMPLMKGMQALFVRDYTRVVDREATNGSGSQPHEEPIQNDSAELTDDDIPFSVVLPFLLPLSMMGTFLS